TTETIAPIRGRKEFGQALGQALFGGRRELGMRRLCGLLALIGALLLASAASTAGAAPLTDRFHGTFSDTFPDNICAIDGTSLVKVMGNKQLFTTGPVRESVR